MKLRNMLFATIAFLVLAGSLSTADAQTRHHRPHHHHHHHHHNR